MTNTEASEILEKKIVPCVKHSDWEVAVRLAISAIEKQIPKAPQFSSDGYDPEGMEVWDAYCPNCEYELDEGKVCPNCGQFIDWIEGEKGR